MTDVPANRTNITGKAQKTDILLKSHPFRGTLFL